MRRRLSFPVPGPQPQTVAVDDLPEGLKPVRFGAPADGDLTWNGELYHGKAGAFPALIVELLPGYEKAFDVCADRWAVFKTPARFPKPESGDWLDVAAEEVLKLLAVPCSYDADLKPPTGPYQEPWSEKAEPYAQRFGQFLAFIAPEALTVTAVYETILAAAAEIAQKLSAAGGAIVTGDLPVPHGVTEARAEVRRGLAMRYVRAIDFNTGNWIVRFDVLCRLQQPKEQTNE